MDTTCCCIEGMRDVTDHTPNAHRQEVRLRMTKADQARLAKVAADLGIPPRRLQAYLITSAWHRLTGDVQAGRVTASELRALAGLFGRADDVPDDLEDHEPARGAIEATSHDKENL
jgi:hypothetical protein